MEQPSIYDDQVYGGEEKISSSIPYVPSRASIRSTPSLDPVPIVPSRKKVWSAPIVPRDKLVDTLNALEQEHHEVITVLTISVGQLQIVCYQEIER